jgi:hypothetical protein
MSRSALSDIEDRVSNVGVSSVGVSMSSLAKTRARIDENCFDVV